MIFDKDPETERRKKALKAANEPENLVELVPEIKKLTEKLNERHLKGEKDLEKYIQDLGKKYKTYKDIIIPSYHQYLNLIKILPVKIVGLGKAGAGKTELLIELFSKYDPHNEEFIRSIEEKHKGNKDLEKFISSAAGAGTLEPYTVTINMDGFKAEITDIVGFGGTDLKDEHGNIERCERFVEESGFIYYVFNGTERAYGPDKVYMNRLFKNIKKEQQRKILIIVSQIDNMSLTVEELRQGKTTWDRQLNAPTPECEALIQARIDKDIMPIIKDFNIKKDQIVPCSVVFQYNIQEIMDKIVQYADDGVKVAILDSIDKIKEISSLNYALSKEKDQILKMDKYEIETVLRSDGLNKGLRHMYQKRLDELNRVTEWDKIKKSKLLLYPFKRIKELIDDKRFTESTYENSEGLKVRKEIFEELAKYFEETTKLESNQNYPKGSVYEDMLSS